MEMMYTIIIQDKTYKKTAKVNMEMIPRIGDTIPIFYKPYPKVIDVVLNIGSEESNEIFNELNILIKNKKKIHAFVHIR
jgi:hypothetical protein